MSNAEILIALEQCHRFLKRYEHERNWLAASDEAICLRKLYADLQMNEALRQQLETPVLCHRT